MRAVPSDKTGREAKRCLQAQLSVVTWSGKETVSGRPGASTGRKPAGGLGTKGDFLGRAHS